MNLLKAMITVIAYTVALSVYYAIAACFQAIVIATPLYFGLYFIMTGDAPITYPEFGRIVLLFTGAFNMYNLIDILNNMGARSMYRARLKYKERIGK